MYFAHIIGEHHHESLVTGLVHSVMSWTGLLISIFISLLVGHAIYLRFRRTKAKEKVNQ